MAGGEKIIIGDIQIGNIISYNNGKYKILKMEHVKPGKGRAFYQVEMKEITVGTKLNERIRSEEKVTRLNQETLEFQFLYQNGNTISLMNKESYDEIEVNVKMFNKMEMFLTDNMIVLVEYVNGDLTRIELPINLEGEVSETPPNIKNASANASFKNAILTNGYKVNVPPFIEVGGKIIINSETGEYAGKVK